jgi:lipid-A-disaccharide synthase
MKPLRIGIIAGEESGDLLGADLVASLRTLTDRPIELVGVGGRHLQAHGLTSLFDPAEIAIMGVTAVVKDLPRLLWRIGSTARTLAASELDVLVTIDSPDFSLRVARKLRALAPQVRTVHYVCPSVWAWRPGRAPAMKAYIDRILCVLPFEPAELVRLGGPAGVFVGHRLTGLAGVKASAAAQQARQPRLSGPRRLVVLPGSRRSEVKGLMEPFRKSVEILAARLGDPLEITIPTVPHVAGLVGQLSRSWPIEPRIVLEPEEKWRAFAEADAALAASGTVLLELALSRVPYVACYKTDVVVRALLGKFITIWSASLPNLIADRVVAHEYYDEFIRPGMAARQLEQLMRPGSVRQVETDGFDVVAEAMQVDEPPGVAAARAVIELIDKT